MPKQSSHWNLRVLMAFAIANCFGAPLGAQTTTLPGALEFKDSLLLQDTDTSSNPVSVLIGAYDDDPLTVGPLVGGFETQYDAAGNLDFILYESPSSWTWWTAEPEGTNLKESMKLDPTGLTIYGRDTSGDPVESVKLIPASGTTGYNVN